jgi:hypothetical protein
VDVNVLLVAHASAAAACVALLAVVARRGGSARFVALCAVVALLHLGDVAYLRGHANQSVTVLTHVVMALFSPLLAMVMRPHAPRYESGILWLASIAASAVTIATRAQLRPSPALVLAAIVLGYLIVERLAGRPAGVAARGIVASLVMTEIFVVVLMASGSRPGFPRPEWWLYAFGEISTVPLLLLLATDREGLPLADALIRRGLAAIAVLTWIAFADRWFPALVVGFASIAIWYAVSRWVRGQLVPQRVVNAGLESQRLLARRMGERELVDQTCALLRAAFDCDVTFDGREFVFAARRGAFSAGELSIVEGVRDQLGAAIEAEGHRRREYHMRELAARAELSALRAQIQPHFLFNVLNTLAELVRQNASAAEAMVEQLADIFRYALAATRRELVPLGEEVDFVRAYLAIEQARFESRLAIELDVAEECRAIQVPPMTLQPLVENAIRHGVARSVSGGTVSVAVHEQDAAVRIVVMDRSGDRTLDASSGEGIALDNVRARLAGLVGARLDVARIPHGTAVTIEVPL